MLAQSSNLAYKFFYYLTEVETSGKICILLETKAPNSGDTKKTLSHLYKPYEF